MKNENERHKCTSYIYSVVFVILNLDLQFSVYVDNTYSLRLQ